MSQTDAEQLRAYFADELVPAARALRERGVTFFAQRPDGHADSWYVDAATAEPDLFEVEADDAERTLREMWLSEGVPELAALAASLMQLAGDVRLDEDQSAEVSPFMYVMY